MEAECGDQYVSVASQPAVHADSFVLEQDAGLSDKSSQSMLFTRTLYRRIDDFFRDHNISPKLDGRMKVKIASGFSVWAAGFFCLYFNPAHHLWQLLLAYFWLALAQTFMVLNVAHDSIHGALSHRPSVNRAFSYIYDGCGVSSHLVRILHNHGHHYCMNVYGEDDPLEGRHVFRFTRSAELKGFHRVQHKYALLLYTLFSIDYIFVRDFEDLLFSSHPTLKNRQHLLRDAVILIVAKSVYLACMVLVPVMLLHYSVVAVIVGFLLMHVLIGFAVATVFAPTHILACNDFPTKNVAYEDFVHYTLATTADFAVESLVVTWLTGGLNHHIVHHICPQVCHIHYPSLTRIVRETAEEFNVFYKHHRTMTAAVRAHLSFLKELGETR